MFRRVDLGVVLKISLKFISPKTNKRYAIKFCTIRKQEIVKSTLRIAIWVHPIWLTPLSKPWKEEVGTNIYSLCKLALYLPTEVTRTQKLI